MAISLKIELALASLFIWGAAHAAEQAITCPSEIAESSIRLTNIPQQWRPHVASPLYLSSAVIAAGPPEQLATLMGDSSWKKGSTEWSTTYDLTGDSFVAGKWVECRYGEYGQMLLSTRLDDKIKSCTVHIHKAEKAGQRTVAINCR